MADKFKMGLLSVVSTALFLGLAVLGWGSFTAFFAHPARVAVVVVTFALVAAALFTQGQPEPGRARGSRQSLGARRLPADRAARRLPAGVV
jgi:hypothetical protein